MALGLRSRLEAAFVFSLPLAWYGGLFALLIAPSTERAAGRFAAAQPAPEFPAVAWSPAVYEAPIDAPSAPPDAEPGAVERPPPEPAAAEPGAVERPPPEPAAAEPSPVEGPAAGRAPGRAAAQIDRRVRTGPPPAGGERRRARRADCDTDEGIVQIAEARFQVPRELVDYYSRNLAEAARLAAVSWHRGPDGEVDGFRLRRMSCANVLRQAGLRNGDVIHAINGREVTTIAQALKAYARLRGKRSLRLRVTRRDGSEVSLRYRLL